MVRARSFAAAAAVAAVGGVLSACGGADTPSALDRGGAALPGDARRVGIYSPAAPPNMLWARNDAVTRALNACSADGTVFETVPQPLPDSVNDLGARDDRGLSLPIVTTVDFEPARAGTGPTWHPYPVPRDDLAFVASLYEVGMGVMVFGDEVRTPDDLRGLTIAVPRRPSSLRVMAEAILRDGYGLLDEVTLLDLPPPKVAEAVATGRVQATLWNMMVEGEDGGYDAFLPDLAERGGRWLPLAPDMAEAVSSANGFTTAAVTLPGEDEPVAMSLRMALAAWSETPDAVVGDVLACLAQDRPAAAMADWPGLSPEQTHPAAAAFYAARR